MSGVRNSRNRGEKEDTKNYWLFWFEEIRGWVTEYVSGFVLGFLVLAERMIASFFLSNLSCVHWEIIMFFGAWKANLNMLASQGLSMPTSLGFELCPAFRKMLLLHRERFGLIRCIYRITKSDYYRVAHEKPARRLVDQRGRGSRTLYSYRKLNKCKCKVLTG